MFCRQCGAAAGEGGGFCGQCGAPLSPVPGPSHFSYHGTGGGLLKLMFVNLLLFVATAGIYFFWARTRLRRYIAGNVEFGRERFVYSGTGLELLIGFLKAVAIVGALFGAAILLELMLGMKPGGPLVGLLLFGALLAVMPIILTGSRRYQLSRTAYRNVRFSFRGTVGRCARVYYAGLFLTIITLGFYLPFFHNRLAKFFMENTWYGNLKFEYDGEGEPLFGSHLLGVILAPITLGFSYLWYQAKLERHVAYHTSIMGTRFQSTVDGTGLFELKFTNGLLILFTLGIGWTWALTRSLRFHIGRLSSCGPLNLEQARQQAMEATATGEGLGLILDTPAGLVDDAF